MKNLNLNKRQNGTGHYARKCRKKGMIPGVIYGKLKNNILFEIGELDLYSELSEVGEHGVINYTLEGENHSALLKEIQRDPVTKKIIHLDLAEVDTKSDIQAQVPIEFCGEEWVHKNGGILQKEQDLVNVSCKAENLPKSIKVDVSNMPIGSVLRYCDLEVAEEVSIIDELDKVVLAITTTKNIQAEINEAEEVQAKIENKED